MAASHEFGRACEALAARDLVRRGWTILDRNYRVGRSEIDLIARCGTTVAFVEVKGRTATRYGDALDSITAAKRAEICRVARVWVERHGRPGWRYRFDAIAVRSRAGRAVLEHVEDAWRL